MNEKIAQFKLFLSTKTLKEKYKHLFIIIEMRIDNKKIAQPIIK
jgi:hypothetical protein